MLSKIRFTVLFLVLVVFLSGCSLPGGKKGALSVGTSPRATLFLDGEHLGQTPYYNEKLKPGEYVLKIVPESSGQALTPWEGRINLTPGVLTVVNRQLGLTQDDSSGEILSFEPIADKTASSISVVTTPDGAVVQLDGEPKGFAPLSIDKVSEGSHVLLITSSGYQDKTINVTTVKGNKLIANIQLARSVSEPPAATETETETDSSPQPSPRVSPAPSPTPSPKASPKSSPSLKISTPAPEPARPYVEINSPDTGWVRVRSEPNTAATELTKVDHGAKFPLKDTQNGWYKIEYETSKTGWISGKYAEKFE